MSLFTVTVASEIIVPLYKTNFFKRTVTAIIAISCVLFLILYANPVIKDTAVGLFFLLAIKEWHTLTSKNKEGLLSLVVTLLCSASAGALFYLGFDHYSMMAMASSCLLPLMQKRYIFIVGYFYITIAFAFLYFFLHQSPFLLFWLLGTVWSADIGAYLVGKSCGGPLLCPKISPKKTWSGFLGGTIIPVLMMGYFATRYQIIPYPFLITGLLAVVSHGGDLLESVAKRYFGVKDSGNIFPGHGGILDRVDGLMAVLIISGLIVFLT